MARTSDGLRNRGGAGLCRRARGQRSPPLEQGRRLSSPRPRGAPPAAAAPLPARRRPLTAGAGGLAVCSGAASDRAGQGHGKAQDRGDRRRRHRPGGDRRRARGAGGARRRASRGSSSRSRASSGARRYYRAHRPDDAGGRPRAAARVRCDLFRRGRRARHPGRRHALGPPARDLPGLRPVRQRPPGAAAAGRQPRRCGASGPADLDWVVVRENTEGEYAGAGGRVHRGLPEEVGTEVAIFTRAGCERIMRFAFELARSRPKRQLTLVTKSNAQRHGMVLWDEIFAELERQFPEVAHRQGAGRRDDHADGAEARDAGRDRRDQPARRHPLRPGIGALAARSASGPTANLNPERRFPSMFEPIHGSAFDITGKGVANPIASFWSARADARPPGRAGRRRATDGRDRAHARRRRRC